jgi:hypothetical protein
MTSKVMGARLLVSVLVAAGISACMLGDEDTGDSAEAISSQDRAKQIFQRLTGTGLQENDPRYAQMVGAIDDNRVGDAARIATADPNFYGVVLRNWAAPFSSVDGAIDNEFDDLQALALGLVRDDADARLLLTGKVHYEAASGANIPAYSEANNDHYKALEDRNVDLGTALQKKDAPGISSPEYAGVLTTRGFGKAYYAAGTNRRAVVYSIKNFLCTPQSAWRDPNLPENFIRRDVHRDPPSNYEAECRLCHAPMDGMSGAFAHFDFVDGHASYYGPYGIAPKYNINTSVYPDGYQPTDDSWINYATQHQNVGFGWHGDLRGKGINAYGTMLANSDAFAKCMVKTAFQATCRRAPESTDQSFIDQTVTGFVGGGYKLRTLFETIAASNQCP